MSYKNWARLASRRLMGVVFEECQTLRWRRLTARERRGRVAFRIQRHEAVVLDAQRWCVSASRCIELVLTGTHNRPDLSQREIGSKRLYPPGIKPGVAPNRTTPRAQDPVRHLAESKAKHATCHALPETHSMRPHTDAGSRGLVSSAPKLNPRNPRWRRAKGASALPMARANP